MALCLRPQEKIKSNRKLASLRPQTSARSRVHGLVGLKQHEDQSAFFCPAVHYPPRGAPGRLLVKLLRALSQTIKCPQ